MLLETQKQSDRIGVFAGIGAYLFWGLIAVLFFKQLGGVGALEIVGFRVVGSVVCLLAFLYFTTGFTELIRILRSRPLVACLLLTAILVSCNWLIFIWAVGRGQIVQCSLGYFITPLFQVALGVVVLGERLRIAQVIAVVLACLAVAIQIAILGEVPWIALGLATSFSFYALIRKRLSLQAVPALTVECLLLLPAGIALAVLPQTRGIDHSPLIWIFLSFSGAVTAIPLVLFGIAARRLQLSTIGFLQYLGPTCQFALATLYYGETVGKVQLACFGLIWIALLVFSIDTIYRSNRPKPG